MGNKCLCSHVHSGCFQSQFFAVLAMPSMTSPKPNICTEVPNMYAEPQLQQQVIIKTMYYGELVLL